MKNYETEIEIKRYHLVIRLIYDVSDEDKNLYLKFNIRRHNRYRIIINLNQEKIAEYVAICEREPKRVEINRFFLEFLADVDYRKQFLVEGSWEGTINWDEPISPYIETLITRINSIPIEELKDYDSEILFHLRDQFIGMRKEELEKRLRKQDIEKIDLEFKKEEYRLLSKKWVVRGMELERTIKLIKSFERKSRDVTLPPKSPPDDQVEDDNHMTPPPLWFPN